MKTHRFLRGILFAAGLLAAAALPAQFVSLSRCQAAYPCAIPFAVQYRPDPLLASHYGRVPDSALSLRLPLRAPLLPELDRRPQPDLAAVEAAVRKSLEMNPPDARKSGTGSGKPAAQPATREKS